MAEESDSDDGPVTARDGLSPNVLLAEKYRVVRALASGGMGRLVVARQVELDRDVVIKVMHAELVRDELMTTRFFREAKLLAALDSDHVVKILDVGRLGDGLPYLVMELLEGEDLESRCERGSIPIDAAVRFIIEACDGLAEAHAIGVIHRDVKPENLFLARTRSGVERIKVLDFGIAKKPASSTASRGATTGESIIGSPAFMAPEQIVSPRDVDARADVWSLGATLYQLLAGSPPFRGEDNIRVLTNILHSAPTPIRIARPEIGSKLAEIVHACLAKKPEERPQTVKELASRLRALGDAKANAKDDAKDDVKRDPPDTPPSRNDRGRTRIMLLAFLATVIVGGVLLASYFARKASRRTSTTTSVASINDTRSNAIAPSSAGATVADSATEPTSAASVEAPRRSARPLAAPAPSTFTGTANMSASVSSAPLTPGRHGILMNRTELFDEEAAVIFAPAFESSMESCARRAKYPKGTFSALLVIHFRADNPTPNIDFFWRSKQDQELARCVLGVAQSVKWKPRNTSTRLRMFLDF